MVGRTESLAGIPGLSFGGEEVTVFPGPQPALGAWLAPRPCKHRPEVSCRVNCNELKACSLKSQNLATALTEGQT